MKCKHCKRQIADNSIYCNWCGTAQISVSGLSVPEPRLLPSGKWNIQLRAEGLSVTEKTREACISKAEELRRSIAAGESASNMTVAEAINRYIKNREGVLSPTTIKAYKSISRNRFQPEMNLPIKSINWQAAISREAREVKAKTLKNAWGLIQSALDEQGISVPKVKLPQAIRKEMPWFSFEELPLFLSCIEGTDIELACLLGLHSLRRSEIYGLTLDDIDLDKKIIRVQGAAVLDEVGALIYKDENKTVQSRRDIPFLIPRIEIVTRQIKEQGGEICSVHPNALYKKINKLCREHYIKEIGVHGLRRSFASLAYHLGWSERETMAIGGWSDMNIMHKFYIKLSEADTSKAAKTMKDFYKKKSPY
jgi:integrase